MNLRRTIWLVAMMAGLAFAPGCDKGNIAGWGDAGGSGGKEGPPPAPCNGTDKDGDGYGTGCAKGNDCDDSNKYVNPGAPEVCNGKDDNCNGKKDEGVLNSCGNCAQTCASVGKGKPFPTKTASDPNVKDSKGVGLDKNGDLILSREAVNFNYMWIANTYDYLGSNCAKSGVTDTRCRGTISKVDTVKMKEVARYYTVTCYSRGISSSCTDINGKAIKKNHNHTPSRTAVDYNFDVWVANRSVHGGQPSATKIANDTLDCVDRNKNGKIDTSKDQNGDNKITMDCNGDGKPDGYGTKCSGSLAGKSPEFLGDDDECIIMTTNYGQSGDVGRSICLDMGKSMVGASNAWVGTFYSEERGHGKNNFYKINGNTGKIETQIPLPSGHHSYGCMADAHNVVWSTDLYGSLAYVQTVSPYAKAPKKLVAPWVPKGSNKYHHYGIALDGNSHVWLGGYSASWVLRYKPKRTSWATLGQGTWTRIDVKPGFVTRGIAVDNRGFVWVAIQNGGYILRLAQNTMVADGIYNRTGTPHIWRTKADTVIGTGVDFSGNVWAVGYKNGYASRLDVDAKGNVKSTGMTNNVKIGQYPYTYSDFTGYGLMNFVRPSGRYVYQLKACSGKQMAQWKELSWKATVPTATVLVARVRSGSSETSWGKWVGPLTKSPANIAKGGANAIAPNPSTYIQAEFTFTNRDKSSTPVLHDFGFSYTCVAKPD